MSSDNNNVWGGLDFSGISNPALRSQLEKDYWNGKIENDGLSGSVPSVPTPSNPRDSGSPASPFNPRVFSESITSSNNSSADKAADSANEQTSDWFKQAMDFNAEQARLNREFQQSSADKAMLFEAEEAQKLRDWQETLSNSQYQRAVADLRKAGLNPILVAQHLSAASTPSGSSASGSSASGSSASVSQSSATKAEVDLNSRTRIFEAYLNAETSLKTSQINAISRVFSALLRTK